MFHIEQGAPGAGAVYNIGACSLQKNRKTVATPDFYTYFATCWSLL